MNGHPGGCKCALCELEARPSAPAAPPAGLRMRDRINGAGLITPDGARVVPRKRFALECEACGSDQLAAVGPYTDGDIGAAGDVGLRWVFTCQRCGEQLRMYATSKAWRERRAASSMIAACIEQGARPCTCSAEHLEGCPAKLAAPS